MGNMTEKAKQIIDSLLSLPEEEFLKRLDEHKPTELGKLLEESGFAKTQAEDIAMRSLLRNFAKSASDIAENISLITFKTGNDILIKTKLETMQHLLKQYEEFIVDKDAKRIHGDW